MNYFTFRKLIRGYYKTPIDSVLMSNLWGKWKLGYYNGYPALEHISEHDPAKKKHLKHRDIKDLWLGECFRQKKAGNRIWCVLRQYGTGPGPNKGHAEVIELRYKGPGAIGNSICRLDWGNKVEFIEMQPVKA